MQPSSNAGSFSGIKVSQPGIDVRHANPNQLLYTNDYSTETFYDKDGNSRVAVGLQADGTYGMRASLPGQSTDTEDFLTFNSQTISGALIVQAVNVPNDASTVSVPFTVSHNLGYVPSYSVIALQPSSNLSADGSVHIPIWTKVSAYNDLTWETDMSLEIQYVIGVDTENLYVTVEFQNFNPDIAIITTDPTPVQYYIYAARAIPS